MTTEKFKTDIVIVGAGLVGLSVALSMKNTDCAIYILENNLSSILSQSENNSQPISLSFGSVRILKALTVWNELEKQASPILSVHVSEQHRFGITRFTATEEKVPALGYVVPYSKLYAALYNQVVLQKNIALRSIQKIEKIKCDVNGAVIQTDSNTIEATLLIAADGTHSTCRDLLGIDYSEKNHDDVAMIFQLTLSENHNNTAYERFTQHGVLAVLPLHDPKQAQLVWSRSVALTLPGELLKRYATDYSDCQKLTQKRERNEQSNELDATLHFLQSVFENRLFISSIQKISEFPLKTQIAEKQITDSAVLLGNAAHTIYPIAAQGFNLGLHDISVLADTLHEALQYRKNIGALSVLKNYETRAHEHQKIIVNITDQLNSIFELPLMGCARGLGLLAMDVIHPIKHHLAKRTMGITKKLPRLLRSRS